MSILLYIVGAIAIMLGVGMAGWGIPINEFSFGNTLIVSGVTLTSGGLIVVGLAAVVGRLKRVAEALAARTAIAEHPPFDLLPEAPVADALPPRAPFTPPPPRAEAGSREPPAPSVPPPFEAKEPTVAVPPHLPNPEASSFAFKDEVLLPAAAEPSREDGAPPRLNGGGLRQAPRFEPPVEPTLPPPRETPPSIFESMWPPEPEPRRTGSTAAPKPAPKFEPKPEPAFEPKPEPEFEPFGDSTPPTPESKPEAATAPPKRDVAILKSGVVDGMAYTLYVDGSIEAQMPQGTLHFASIDELRSHLEKTTPPAS